MTCGTVPSLSNNSGAQQEPHCLLERPKEALQKFTNLDLDSSEGQVILFYLFIYLFDSNMFIVSSIQGYKIQTQNTF